MNLIVSYIIKVDDIGFVALCLGCSDILKSIFKVL